MQETHLALANSNESDLGPAWTRLEPVRDEFHRFYFPVAGRAVIYLNGRATALQRCGAALIPAHHEVAHECRRRFHLHWVHVQPRSLRLDRRLAQLNRVVTWPPRAVRDWSPVYTRLAECTRADDEALALRVRAMLLWLIGDALRVHPPPSAADNRLEGAAERLGPALSLMDERYCENPPLATIAAAVHMSPVYFHRLFKRVWGVTPHAYMQRKRMREARRLLVETNEPIGAIAERTGHGSVYYFSRAFRRHHRCSPRAFRERGGPDLP